MKSIFIQLAAYHDYELPETILDCIEQSSGKYQLNFGVHLCYKDNNDIVLPDLPNIQVATSKAPKNIGLGWGRYLAHQFYNGEDFYLQIDSHSKMDKNWDLKLIEQIYDYQLHGFAKPLITNYPRNYWYDENGLFGCDIGTDSSEIKFIENPEQFKESLLPSQTAYTTRKNNVFSKSISGGSVFTVGQFISPNTDISFYGEEIFIAARAYTHGFDLLIPKEQFMYHLYFDHKNPTRNKRTMVWKDYPKEFNEMDIISRDLIKKMFKENIVGEGFLGTARTLKEFEQFSGLNFTTGEITECDDEVK
jgi:hypothetical protein